MMARDYRRYCDWCGRSFTSDHKEERFCDNRCKRMATHQLARIRAAMHTYDLVSDYLRERERRDR